MTGIGASAPNPGTSANNIQNFRNHVGPTDWFRFYIGTTTEPAWASSTFNIVRAADALGERCVISFKTAGNWSQVAAGARDAFLTQLASGAQTGLTNPGIFCFYHEPENDAPGMGTSAQFRAAMTHVINVMRPLAPSWKFYNCYMDYTFSTFSSRDPDDWYVPELDGIGFDFYNWAPSNDGGPWATVNPSTISPQVVFRNEIPARRLPFPKDDIRNYAASKQGGLPYFLMETGCAIRSPGGPTQELERTAWMTSLADYLAANPSPQFIGITYFSFNAGEAVYNWAFDRDSGIGFAPATAAQFARINDVASAPTTMKVLLIDDGF
jgi:hypothetical protein